MKYPKDEIVWTGYYDREGNLRYVITSKETRDSYFLYEAKGDALVKLGKAKEPTELVKKYGVEKAIGVQAI